MNLTGDHLHQDIDAQTQPIDLLKTNEVHIITRTLTRHETFSKIGAMAFARDITNSKFKFDFKIYSHIVFCPAVTVDQGKKSAKAN